MGWNVLREQEISIISNYQSRFYLLIARGKMYLQGREICHTYNGKSQMIQLSKVNNGSNWHLCPSWGETKIRVFPKSLFPKMFNANVTLRKQSKQSSVLQVLQDNRLGLYKRSAFWKMKGDTNLKKIRETWQPHALHDTWMEPGF